MTALLRMLEDRADNQGITAFELTVVRCIVETYAANLGRVLEEIRFTFTMISPIRNLLEGNRKYNAGNS